MFGPKVKAGLADVRPACCVSESLDLRGAGCRRRITRDSLACAIENDWNDDVTWRIEEIMRGMYGCPRCPAKLSRWLALRRGDPYEAVCFGLGLVLCCLSCCLTFRVFAQQPVGSAPAVQLQVRARNRSSDAANQLVLDVVVTDKVRQGGKGARGEGFYGARQRASAEDSLLPSDRERGRLPRTSRPARSLQSRSFCMVDEVNTNFGSVVV